MWTTTWNTASSPICWECRGRYNWLAHTHGISCSEVASTIAYRMGNDLAAAISASPTVSDQQLCTTLGNSRLRTGIATWRSGTDLFGQELIAFGKQSCVPCPYGCPEALIQKDFAVQPWELDNGTTITYTP